MNDEPPECVQPFGKRLVCSTVARSEIIMQLECEDKRNDLAYSIVGGMEWMEQGAEEQV